MYVTVAIRFAMILNDFSGQRYVVNHSTRFLVGN